MLGCLYVFPQEAAASARDALALFGNALVPTLGPCMVLCLFLCSRLPGSGLFPIISGFLCGSPGGAKMMQGNDWGGKIPRREMALTGVMSPAFFLGTLSGWLASQRIACLLYFCHVLGAVLSALCMRKVPSVASEKTPLSLFACIGQSIQALLQVGYFVMLGTVASRMCACALPFLPEGVLVFLQSLMEVTGGARAVISLSPGLLYPLLSAATSFGGLSILMQNLSFWQEKGVTFVQLTLVQLLHAAISFLLCFFLQILSLFG